MNADYDRRILALLKENGEMTAYDIAVAIFPEVHTAEEIRHNKASTIYRKLKVLDKFGMVTWRPVESKHTGYKTTKIWRVIE